MSLSGGRLRRHRGVTRRPRVRESGSCSGSSGGRRAVEVRPRRTRLGVLRRGGRRHDRPASRHRRAARRDGPARSMDLRSYDRLFPNQDVLPDGGFCNLIAAPLQRRRRDDGLTVFLDLSTLELGADVNVVGKSTATRVQPRLPAVVRAELGAESDHRDGPAHAGCPDDLQAHSFDVEPQVLRASAPPQVHLDTPRFLRGYDITIDDRARSAAWPVPPHRRDHRALRVQVVITDVRNPGQEIDVTFAGDLGVSQTMP